MNNAGFKVELIHALCVSALQYPEEIAKYEYIPNFTVRGLHYDIQKVNILNVLFQKNLCLQVFLK